MKTGESIQHLNKSDGNTCILVQDETYFRLGYAHASHHPTECGVGNEDVMRSERI